MRSALEQMVESEPGLHCALATGNPHEAFEAVLAHKPGLVLLDMTLPEKNGLELLKDIRAADPNVPVLVISMHDEALYAERVLRAGGRGYVMKDAGPDQMLAAVRQVLSGQIYVSQRIAGRILEIFSTGRRPVAPEQAGVDQLSDREFQVFQLIGKGRSTREISEILHISPKTVEVHRIAIKKKLNLATGAELGHRAALWIDSQPSGGL